jgi:pectate lyase
MKYSTLSLSLGLLATLATAAPTPTIIDDTNFAEVVKRASVTDMNATLPSWVMGKYADSKSLVRNWLCFPKWPGTAGGAGGTTTTISTYAQFTAAVSGTDKKFIIVDGAITQAADQVKVGSNTSIIGKDSGASFTGFGL